MVHVRSMWREPSDDDDGGSGTEVVANPPGTDGDPLTRISIGGINYVISATAATVTDGSITLAKLAPGVLQRLLPVAAAANVGKWIRRTNNNP